SVCRFHGAIGEAPKGEANGAWKHCRFTNAWCARRAEVSRACEIETHWRRECDEFRGCVQGCRRCTECPSGSVGVGPASESRSRYSPPTALSSGSVVLPYSCRGRCGAEDARPVPRAAVSRRSKRLLNQLVSTGEQAGWYNYAKCLRCFEIDCKLE